MDARRLAVGPTVGFALVAAACGSASDPSAGSLDVTPAAVTCTAGDRVTLHASLDGGPATPIEFEAAGGGIWLTRPDRSTASVACEAAGQHRVQVTAGPHLVVVPVAVQPPAAGTLQLTVTPSPLTLVNGSVQLLAATVTSSRPGVSTAVRFLTADTALVVVDSIAGTVRARGPGTTQVVVQTYADPATRVVVPVTVTRGSAVVVGLAPDPFNLLLQVGDSARLGATVFLAPGAPATTSRASTFTSTNPDVVRVTGNVARAVGAGTATIVVAPVASPALKAGIPVTVRDPAP